MRLSRVLLLILALLLVTVSAVADQVAIGVLSFDQPLGNEFDITNYTGAGAQPLFGFPVLTGLTLTGTLNLMGACSPDCSVPIVLAPNAQYNGTQFDTSLVFTSATFTGTLGPTSGVSVSGYANPVFLSDTFSVVLTDPSGSLIGGVDSAVIYANTVSAPVPEPGSFLLLVSALPVGVFRLRRLVNARSSNT
ncbi:MAG TPA: hypothetical protein VKW78_13680 [Terriglobales bacterium]|nr:hypothetical protein [Terriglobales bacterium]